MLSSRGQLSDLSRWLLAVYKVPMRDRRLKIPHDQGFFGERLQNT
jgi:hypothetical protein